MIWIFLIPIILLFTLLSLVLIPRIRFGTNLQGSVFNISISSICFSFYFDIREKIYRGRIFFYNVIKDKEHEEDASPGMNETESPPPEAEIPGDRISDEASSIHEQDDSSSFTEKEWRSEDDNYRQPSDKKAKKPEKTGKKKKARTEHQKFSWQMLLGERDLFKTVLRRFVRGGVRSFKSFRIDTFKSSLLIAMPDPTWTGICYGIAQPLNYINRHERSSIDITADFDREIPELELNCAVSVRPVRLLFVGFWTIITMPWWRIWKFYRKYIRKPKDTKTRDE